MGMIAAACPTLRWAARLAAGVLVTLGWLLAAPGAQVPQPPEQRADRIVIEKQARRLTIYRARVPIKTYRVALGFSPVGHKTREGDGKTPEGLYVIDSRLAKSQFHRALHISYPNAADREAARRAGVSPGGAIMIHGLGKGWGWLGRAHRLTDWTSGCIAVTNEEIEELWAAIPDGTPVEIRP